MDLRKLNQDIIKRRANGKVLWQPRIGCWYDDRVYRKEPLPGKYAGCDHNQLYEKLRVSDRLYQFNECVQYTQDDSIKYSSRKLNDRDTEHAVDTPVGRIYQVLRTNSDNPGVMPIKWLVETEDDLKVMMYIDENTNFKFDMATYDRLENELGRLGLPTMFVQRTNMQHMLIGLSGVENTYYLMQDCPDTLEAYFKVRSENDMRLMEVVAACPIEWINYGDNLHDKILPLNLFEKYILPEYEKRGDILHKAGKFTFSHWDGDCKSYLKHAKSCFLNGIEAITPIPQGDVTLEETKAALGDEIVLIDGVAAILFNDTYPLEALTAQVQEALDLFPGQLIMGISDELPSDGLLERVEHVRDLVENYNAKL